MDTGGQTPACRTNKESWGTTPGLAGKTVAISVHLMRQCYSWSISPCIEILPSDLRCWANLYVPLSLFTVLLMYLRAAFALRVPNGSCKAFSCFSSSLVMRIGSELSPNLLQACPSFPALWSHPQLKSSNMFQCWLPVTSTLNYPQLHRTAEAAWAHAQPSPACISLPRPA